MSPQKSPAFSFYAKDFLTGTSTMSLQEVGAYVRLLAYQWDAGSVPEDASERARVLGCAKAQEKEIWKKVGRKFVLEHGVYLNARLEEERFKQTERSRRLSDNGKLGGRPKKAEEKQNETNSFPVAKADGNLNERLPSSSSFSSSANSSKSDELGGAPSARPTLIARGDSVRFFRLHGQHVDGFCDWVCLAQEQVDEFAKKIPGDDLQLKRGQIRDWALTVRAQWADRIVGDGSHFEFWRNRWTETHGGSRPANATLKAARAAADLDEAFR